MVSAPAPTTLSAGLADGGTFISARIERISPTVPTSQPISASASASIQLSGSSGHWAEISMLSRAGPNSAVFSHSSSVMNGITGCRSFRITSSAQAAVARVSALAAASSPFRIGLASSRYQSQNTFQTKRYRAPAASSNAGASRALVTSATVLTVSPRIHLLIGCCTVAGSKPSTRTHSFIWAKREAFHSLVPKLR